MPDLIPIPMVKAYRFDCDVLRAGIPVIYRHTVNDHDFHGLVSDVGLDKITLTNGFVETGITIDEVVRGEYILYPLMDPGAATEYEIMVFDVDEIPIGTILHNKGDNTSLIIVEVETYCLTGMNSFGSQLIYAYDISDLDYLILPPPNCEEAPNE